MRDAKEDIYRGADADAKHLQNEENGKKLCQCPTHALGRRNNGQKPVHIEREGCT